MPVNALSHDAPNCRVGREVQGAAAPIVKIRQCTSLEGVCELLGISGMEMLHELGIAFEHLHVKEGHRVHTIGESFAMLYIVNSGFLKSVLVDECGNRQVLDFPMKGDILGIDGIHGKQYATEAVALTDCNVILVPFEALTRLGKQYPDFEAAVFGAMSRELLREQQMLSLLASVTTEARVARFLIMLSERFSNMGFSGRRFMLRMTRRDIGSYLGMTLETVSRTLSAFDAIGLISVDHRAIEIRNIDALRAMRRLPYAMVRRRNVIQTPLAKRIA